MSAIDQIVTGYGWQIGDLDQARIELSQLRADLAAAIQRGDTYRARARALRRQARIYRAYINGNFELGIALMPKSAKHSAALFQQSQDIEP